MKTLSDSQRVIYEMDNLQIEQNNALDDVKRLKGLLTASQLSRKSEQDDKTGIAMTGLNVDVFTLVSHYLIVSASKQCANCTRV